MACGCMGIHSRVTCISCSSALGLDHLEPQVICLCRKKVRLQILAQPAPGRPTQCRRSHMLLHRCLGSTASRCCCVQPAAKRCTRMCMLPRHSHEPGRSMISAHDSYTVWLWIRILLSPQP